MSRLLRRSPAMSCWSVNQGYGSTPFCRPRATVMNATCCSPKLTANEVISRVTGAACRTGRNAISSINTDTNTTTTIVIRIIGSAPKSRV